VPVSTITPERFTSFGALLKHLRLQAQLSQRDLATAVGYHFAHISRLEHDQRVPATPVLLALFVPALKIENEPAWVKRLIELATTASASAAPPTPPNQPPLPIPLTAVLGRRAEAESLTQLIVRAEVPLVTLVGPPGVGKTRLALHVAEQLSAQFADGVAFVDLTQTRDPQLFASTLLEALRLKETPGQSALASLQTALRARRQLVVLDNFEQLVEAAPQLQKILSVARELKCLVTSREALRLAGEHEFPLAPLPTPALTTAPQPPNLNEHAAIALFVERAQAVQPAFRLTADNAPLIATLCQRLDGLPLAIELAAARSKYLSLPAMLDRLGHRLTWLTAGRRDIPDWRQTLRGAIDWSYHLLEPEGQRAFRRLAVCSGSFSLEAATAIGDLGANSLSQILALVDKNLLRLSETPALRFSLLETLREFANERLHEQADELFETQARHARYYTQYLTEPPPLPTYLWFQTLDPDHANLRAALEWSLVHAVEQGMQLACALWPYWRRRSLISEAQHWLERAVAFAPLASPWRIKLIRRLGDVYRELGQFDRARVCLSESLALARQSEPPDPEELIASLKSLGVVAQHHGEGRLAEAYFREGLSLAEQSNDQRSQLHFWRVLGNIQREAGQLPDALAYYQTSTDLARQLDDLVEVGLSLNNLGLLAVDVHDYDRARATFEEVLALCQQGGDAYGAAMARANLGYVTYHQRDYAVSCDYSRTALQALRPTGKKWGLINVLGNLGLALLHLDHLTEAAQCFHEALSIGWQARSSKWIMDTLVGIAHWYARQHNHLRAAELLGLIENHPTTSHETQVAAQALLIELGPAASPADMARGRELGWEAMTQELLAILPASASTT